MRELEGDQQQLYEQMFATRGRPFPRERPPVFSPAAAAQDPANASQIYFRWTPLFLPYEFTNWVSEAQAHVESCYIGDWTAINKVMVRGPEALAFLEHTGMNSLKKFVIGQIKHHIQLDGNGQVASEGVIYRMGEEEFLYTGGGGDWTIWQFANGGWNAELEDVSARRFIFEVQGPKSIHVLEAALGESLRDLRFNRGRPARIGDIAVEVLRTGISGELGYELHGTADDAAEVWSAVTRAGEAFGIRQLGVRSQLVQHIEAGIATAGLDYLPSSIVTPGAPKLTPNGQFRGSFVPRNGVADYFRYPPELGWGARGNLESHDFLGREALVAAQASGAIRRKFVSLVWNTEDVHALFAAFFEEGGGPLPAPMEMPRYIGANFDRVLSGDADVGVSTSYVYSPTLRRVISLAAVDHAHAETGAEVKVLWGCPGTAQREMRAVVQASPPKPDRRRTDVSTL